MPSTRAFTHAVFCRCPRTRLITVKFCVLLPFPIYYILYCRHNSIVYASPVWTAEWTLLSAYRLQRILPLEASAASRFGGVLMCRYLHSCHLVYIMFRIFSRYPNSILDKTAFTDTINYNNILTTFYIYARHGTGVFEYFKSFDMGT